MIICTFLFHYHKSTITILKANFTFALSLNKYVRWAPTRHLSTQVVFILIQLISIKKRCAHTSWKLPSKRFTAPRRPSKAAALGKFMMSWLQRWRQKNNFHSSRNYRRAASCAAASASMSCTRIGERVPIRMRRSRRSHPESWMVLRQGNPDTRRGSRHNRPTR